MSNYWVSQAGSGTLAGTSIGNPCSLAQFNAGSKFTETGGDTVFFLGSITGIVIPPRSGTGNGLSRLTLNFSACTLDRGDNTDQLIYAAGRNYVTYQGGGSWTQAGSGVNSTYTSGCVIGTINSGGIFDFNQVTTHDVTITGFQCINNSQTTGLANFCYGVGSNTTLISNNYLDRMRSMFFADGTGSHHHTLASNYFRTSDNILDQTDPVTLGDGHDMILEYNKLILTAPGHFSHAGPSGARHNDVFQVYQGGGGSSGTPYGITIRYNWLEQAVVDNVDSDGSITFTQLEATGNGSAGFAYKVYGNIFYANNQSDGNSNGGLLGNGGTAPSHIIYYHHNTYVRRHGTDGGAFGIQNSTGGGTVYCENNIFWAPSAFNDGSTVTLPVGKMDYNFSQNWNDLSSTIAGTHGSRTTSIGFTNTSVDDFSLSGTSALRGTADTTIDPEYAQGIAFGSTWPLDSTQLVARPSGASDPGAFQFVSSGTAAPRFKFLLNHV